MFIKATPESAGVPSKGILNYLKFLNKRELSLHSVLIARGDKLICEAYWAPFDAAVPHRMYSQTKSYVGLAVRLLADDGLISLDDKIIKYFPEKLPEKIHPFLAELSIRNMLMMRTCYDGCPTWFTSDTDDRVKYYFSHTPTVYPGTQYHYDSEGSFVMGALVERLTGKTFLDYLRDKCLREIGFSETAYCLKCPGGHSWADSALICTPLDMLKYGRFVGCYGKWKGRQIIRRGIFEEAFSEKSATFESGFRAYADNGYTSQFWHSYGKAFGFNGMHDQFTMYDPETDITFTCTSGNRRNTSSREIMTEFLLNNVIEQAADGALPENEADYRELEDYISGLELIASTGAKNSAVEAEINGRIFTAEKSTTGISDFSFTFTDDKCEFSFVNEQGSKKIVAGRGEYNIFQDFPQTGYSGEVGGKVCPGHTYKCAASFAWESENQMLMKVQIIDEYIGNLYISFAYRDGYARVRMDGDAEHFLKEYNTAFTAKLKA